MKKVYVILAEGFEVIEALTPVDVLKRCGLEVVTLSITDKLEVKSSHGIEVKADEIFEENSYEDGELLILPGGYPGYDNIGKHSGVIKMAKLYIETDKYIGAICGAPLALSKAGLLKEYKVTSHFTVKDDLEVAEWIDEKVVVDKKLITSTGAGRSLDFSLVLGELLTSGNNIEKVKKGMTII